MVVTWRFGALFVQSIQGIGNFVRQNYDIQGILPLATQIFSYARIAILVGHQMDCNLPKQMQTNRSLPIPHLFIEATR